MANLSQAIFQIGHIDESSVQSELMFKQLCMMITENFHSAINNQEFYNIPFKMILRITNEYFNYLESIDKTTDETFHIIQDVIKFVRHVSLNYKNEAPLILPMIDSKGMLHLTFDEIISILASFTNIPILSMLKQEYDDNDHSVDVDWEYELEKKKDEIENLKSKIQSETIPKNISDHNLPSKPENYTNNIFISAMYGDLASIQYLIEVENKDIDSLDKSKSSPLIYASMNNHIHLVEYLIDHGANIDLKNSYGNTALICATKFGNLEIAKLLVERGANLDLENQEGKKAIDYASNPDIRDCLLKHVK